MYRRDGAQVSRVRVRKVANPRTNAQSAQRSFFAPVAKFFSPLSSVLERSWEGLNKSKSYSKFLAENVKLARKNGWLLPKGTGFFPLPYQLSNGTLPNIYVYHSVGVGGWLVGYKRITAVPATVGELSDLFISEGFKVGDIITFIFAFEGANESYYPASVQFECDPTSVVNLGTIFGDIKFENPSEEGGATYSGVLITSEGEPLVAVGVIVARFADDKWKRTLSNLVLSQEFMRNQFTEEKKAAAIASYGNSATGENPLVYLDGDELQG